MSSLNPSSSTTSPFPKFTQFGATSIAHHQQKAAEAVGIQPNQIAYPFSCLPAGAAALSNDSIQSTSSQFPFNSSSSFSYQLQQQFPAQLAASVALNQWLQTLLAAGFHFSLHFHFPDFRIYDFQVKIGLLVERLLNSIPRSQMGMWFYHGYRNL